MYSGEKAADHELDHETFECTKVPTVTACHKQWLRGVHWLRLQCLLGVAHVCTGFSHTDRFDLVFRKQPKVFVKSRGSPFHAFRFGSDACPADFFMCAL